MKKPEQGAWCLKIPLSPDHLRGGCKPTVILKTWLCNQKITFFQSVRPGSSTEESVVVSCPALEGSGSLCAWPTPPLAFCCFSSTCICASLTVIPSQAIGKPCTYGFWCKAWTTDLHPTYTHCSTVLVLLLCRALVHPLRHHDTGEKWDSDRFSDQSPMSLNDRAGIKVQVYLTTFWNYHFRSHTAAGTNHQSGESSY